MEPRNWASLLGREPGLHAIQGIGDGFVPDVLDTSLVEAVITVPGEDAIETVITDRAEQYFSTALL